MSDHQTKATTAKADASQPLTGLVAEFDSPDAVMHAAEKIRDAGFTRWDVHSPFPIHGIDDAMGIRPTVLPYIVAVMAVTGFTIAMALQIYTNGIDYPIIVSGKQPISLEAFVPVSFEVTVLLSSFGAFFGMLLLNGLPQHANPLFRVPNFVRASSDRFFIAIDAQDRKFQQQNLETLLAQNGSLAVLPVYADPSESRVPGILHMLAITAACAALIPPLLMGIRRHATTNSPRLHIVTDMDFQAKFKTQKATNLFADGRAMRPLVPGAIARGELDADSKLNRGLETEAGLMSVNADAPKGAAAQPAGAQAPAAAVAEARELKPWVKTIPIPVTSELMARGEQRYKIYCSMCHGLSGDGDGLVSLRALELQQPTWIKPVSLHALTVARQPVGQLFDTVTNGVRKMPGYAAQISTNDRWAIVLYLKALQESRSVKADEIPEGVKSSLPEPPVTTPAPAAAAPAPAAGAAKGPVTKTEDKPAAPKK